MDGHKKSAILCLYCLGKVSGLYYYTKSKKCPKKSLAIISSKSWSLNPPNHLRRCANNDKKVKIISRWPSDTIICVEEWVRALCCNNEHFMTANEKCLQDRSLTLWHYTAGISGLMALKQMAGLGRLSLVKPHWMAPPLPSFPLSPLAKWRNYYLK